MQVTHNKGTVTVKPWKRELEQIDNMIGMMRYLDRASGNANAKNAADALEKVRAGFTKEQIT
jgi:hypothetical protein